MEIKPKQFLLPIIENILKKKNLNVLCCYLSYRLKLFNKLINKKNLKNKKKKYL